MPLSFNHICSFDQSWLLTLTSWPELTRVDQFDCPIRCWHVAQSTLSPELGFATFRVSWRLVGAATARLTARRSDFRCGGCSDMAVGGGCGGALQLRERRGWLLWWLARREGADAAWLQVCTNRGLCARWLHGIIYCYISRWGTVAKKCYRRITTIGK